MTLERHRNKFMPDIDFGGDGRLFVTDNDGTFPMRGAKKGKEKVPRPDYDEVKSYRSYDPKREQKRRSGRFSKQREGSRFENEVKNITGTLGSNAGSLQRKVRRLKGKEDRDERWEYDMDHPAKRFGSLGTWSSAGKHNKRKRGSKMRDDYPTMGSLNRSSGATKSLDLASIKAYKEKMKDRRSSILEVYSKTNGGKMPLIPELPMMNKRLVDEHIPGVFFIIGGMFLIAIGAVKAVLSWWHTYYCILWTGLLLLIMGIIGATHKGDYLTKWKNGMYITFGVLSSGAVMVTVALLLQVDVPILKEIAIKTPEKYIASNVNFTNMGKSLAIQLEPLSTMVWVSLGVDLAAFVLCLVNFFTLTATMVAIGNHWEAVYLTTGTCDHRGHPRYFNPFEQISIGQATILVGIFVMTLWKTDKFSHFWGPVWSGALVLLAGVISLFQGKRVDLTGLGLFAMLMQVLAVVALTFSSVYALLGLTEDAFDIHDNGSVMTNGEYGETLASAVAEGVYVFFVLINVVFVIGVLFRQCRSICCGRCIEGPEVSKA